MREYKVVPVPGQKMLGGHYAVEDPWGRLVGVSLRLDRVDAETLRFELERAFGNGREEVVRL